MLYVQINKSIMQWEEAVFQYSWLETELQFYGKFDIPDTTVAVYFVADVEMQSLIDHYFVAKWSPDYKTAFRQLNEHWVAKFFEMEDFDYEVLGNPENIVLKDGGEIFFLVTRAGKPIGTVALIIHHGDCELAKMSVEESCQGKGFSHFLMREALRWVNERKDLYPQITLLTSSKSSTAIQLYQKYGFKVTATGPHPAFHRVDVVMHLAV